MTMTHNGTAWNANIVESLDGFFGVTFEGEGPGRGGNPLVLRVILKKEAKGSISQVDHISKTSAWQ